MLAISPLLFLEPAVQRKSTSGFIHSLQINLPGAKQIERTLWVWAAGTMPFPECSAAEAKCAEKETKRDRWVGGWKWSGCVSKWSFLVLFELQSSFWLRKNRDQCVCPWRLGKTLSSQTSVPGYLLDVPQSPCERWTTSFQWTTSCYVQ